MSFSTMMLAILGIGGLLAMTPGPAQAGPVFTVTGGGFFTDRDNDFLWLTPRLGVVARPYESGRGANWHSVIRG